MTSTILNRREVFTGVAASGLLGLSAPSAASSSTTVTILLNEEIGTIPPDLYGYLLEDGGNHIYDGVWVGEKSKIPNIRGIRKALIEHLRGIKASLIRWPGGNAADYYDWRDGIGPRNNRPRRTSIVNDADPANYSRDQMYGPNHFGTHEFMTLCRLSGGRPYINLNLRGMNPQEIAGWVDYCNAPEGSSTWSVLRKANGSGAPFDVDYWGIGNEPWAWGGNMSAEGYAEFYRRLVRGLPRHGRERRFIAAGGPPTYLDTSWTRTFLRECTNAWERVPIHAIGLHYYTGFPANSMYPGESIRAWLRAKDGRPTKLMASVGYNEDEWYSFLADALRVEGLIKANWEAVCEFDSENTIKLMLDEWGALLAVPRDERGGKVRDVATLRNALGAALTFNTLHRHVDKIVAANFTGVVNQAGGLFRAEGDKFVATPVYYIFKMFADHQGAASLRTVVDTPVVNSVFDARTASLPIVNASASRAQDRLTITLVNSHITQAAEIAISVPGATISDKQAIALTGENIRAVNTFEHPFAVVPAKLEFQAGRSESWTTLPPASVAKLSFRIE